MAPSSGTRPGPSPVTLSPKGRIHGPSLALDYVWYLLSNVSIVLTGMVSLPITARVLSKEQFGLLGMFEPLAAIWTALLKFGFQHSVMRFYSTSCLNQPADRRKSFFVTLIWAPQAASALVTLVSAAMLCAVHRVVGVPHFALVLALLLWCQAETSNSLCQSFLTAQRLSHIAARFTAALRFATTVTVLVAVTRISPTATALQWARFGGAVFVGVLIFRTVARAVRPSLAGFDRRLFGETVRYGVPMSLNEVSAIIHDQLDRFVLAAYVGYVDLGLYHLNYSVAQYLGVLMAASFNPAFVPYANQIYDHAGAEEYRKRIGSLLRPLLYVTAAIIAGVFAFAADVVPMLLGSEKARPGLFMMIAVTFALGPAAAVVTQGLSLHKRGSLLLGTLLASCLVNLGANLVLVPRLGVMGAAYATVISVGVLWLSRFVLTPRETVPARLAQMSIRPAAMGLLVCAGTMLVLAHLHGRTVRLSLGGLCFVALASGMTLLLDRPVVLDLRDRARTLLARYRS